MLWCRITAGRPRSRHEFWAGYGLAPWRWEVAAVRGDVGVQQGRDACDILVEHLMAGGAKLVDDALDVPGVPDQHGV